MSEPDDGIYDAMNKGIGLSSGDYLLFLNAGDKLADPDVLYSVKPFSDVGIIYGDIQVTSDETSDLLVLPQKLPEDFLIKKMMPHQSSFIKKSLFYEYGLYDLSYRIAADYDFFVRILHSTKFGTLFDKSQLAFLKLFSDVFINAYDLAIFTLTNLITYLYLNIVCTYFNL